MYKVSNRYIKCKRSWYLFKCGCFSIHLRNKLPSTGLSFCKNFPVNNVLTGLRAQSWTPSYTPGSRAKGAGRITLLPFVPRRHLSAYFPSCGCLRVQLLTSLHVGADCGPCLWNTAKWAHLQPPGCTRSTGGGLDNYKGYRSVSQPNR